MSTFVNHLVDELAAKAIPSSSSLTNTLNVETFANNDQQKQTLRSVLLLLNPPISPELVHESFVSLRDVFSSASDSSDKEEEGLKKAVLGRIIVGVYAEALNTYLDEATKAESEAEWWDSIERSRGNLAWYLLQTLPSRLVKLSRTILRTFHDHKIPLQLSTFRPASLRQIFPSTDDIFRPNALTTALFPHLRRRPHIFSLSVSRSSQRPVEGIPGSLLCTVDECFSMLVSVVTLPIELTRQECQIKRQELEQLRDRRAEVLGMLSEMRTSLANILVEQPMSQESSFQIDVYSPVINALQEKLEDRPIPSAPLTTLHNLALVVLPAHRRANQSFLNAYHHLLRPSRLTLMWPKLLLLPPLILYCFKSIYASRASIFEMGIETWSTIQGFWRGWLVDPLKDVVRTVRAGGEDGVIVQKRAIAADLASLERMVISLARDKLGYGRRQLVELSTQIRHGDLTPVLEIYEQDIRTPVKSALTGSLLRSLFIQVQKAKVDIDQALSGIDKLLKSQELTFAFVGVAPALAIVYVTVDSLQRLWSGGKGRGLYGGRSKRTRAWVAMRQIERLLIALPQNSQSTDSSSIPPLTSGLLLLAVTRLRHFAETQLPASSHIREGLLEDIKDLENPDLGRTEKLRVVDRMWRCWGTSLKWDTVGR